MGIGVIGRLYASNLSIPLDSTVAPVPLVATPPLLQQRVTNMPMPTPCRRSLSLICVSPRCRKSEYRIGQVASSQVTEMVVAARAVTMIVARDSV